MVLDLDWDILLKYNTWVHCVNLYQANKLAGYYKASNRGEIFPIELDNIYYNLVTGESRESHQFGYIEDANIIQYENIFKMPVYLEVGCDYIHRGEKLTITNITTSTVHFDDESQLEIGSDEFTLFEYFYDGEEEPIIPVPIVATYKCKLTKKDNNMKVIDLDRIDVITLNEMLDVFIFADENKMTNYPVWIKDEIEERIDQLEEMKQELIKLKVIEE